MKIINEKERTVWPSNDGKFENFASPNLTDYVDSIPKNLIKNRNHNAFVVPWQMAKEGEIPDKKKHPSILLEL